MERQKNENPWDSNCHIFSVSHHSCLTFFHFSVLLPSRRFLPSEFCDNDFYVLTVSSRQQQQQSYFTLQGDWSVNCDVCECSRNCVFSLLMSASRNTKAKENIFPFVYETKNRFFIRNITLWGFSRHPLYLCRLAMREFFFLFLLFTAEWYVCVSLLCRVLAELRFFSSSRLYQSSLRFCVAERFLLHNQIKLCESDYLFIAMCFCIIISVVSGSEMYHQWFSLANIRGIRSVKTKSIWYSWLLLSVLRRFSTPRSITQSIRSTFTTVDSVNAFWMLIYSFIHRIVQLRH